MSEKNPISGGPAQAETPNENAPSENSFMTQSKLMFDEHKGKLAIGVAATLGVMIFYNWKERQLAKNDPEGHARLQRLKALVRSDELSVPHESYKDHEEESVNLAPQIVNANEGQVSAAK
jgi:hypothetical protein